MTSMADNKSEFSFEISLSVLNHLGRNLYRSFFTVLGEAVSNAWDADANHVWIYVDKTNGTLVVKDDGVGMSDKDFQGKFLKIGYSKRRAGKEESPGGRPYIGRKGIGKLALLSCSEKITIATKEKGGSYVGGIIDNSELDQAIYDDLIPEEYPLKKLDIDTLGNLIDEHQHGTIIYFENIKEGIRNNLDFLRKAIALYFRFSLIDESFKIYLEDIEITINDLNDLADKTQFLWKINEVIDPFVNSKLTKPPLLQEAKEMHSDLNIWGFIASVKKPTHLKITGTEEKTGIDLFVNGRLRERDILKHIPTARIVESYLYGQIHYNDLDKGGDRFTSSREGIVADDPQFLELLQEIQKIVKDDVTEDWDKWRLANKEEGDSENTRITTKARRSRGLYNAVSDEYESSEKNEEGKKVSGWIADLADDAEFNFSSYAECFMSENLLRKYIEGQSVEMSPSSLKQIEFFKEKENRNKTIGGISIELRKPGPDHIYLDMDGLANLVDKSKDPNSLSMDAKQYKPIRDGLMHTSLLTDEAKLKLTSVFNNMKSRVIALLRSTNK